MIHRGISFCAIAVIAMTACNIAPTELYDDMLQAMEAEVEPLVETTIPTELNKDADAIDFDEIRDAATRVRRIFQQARNEQRNVYINSAEKRGLAKDAENWFTSIAAAATHKQADKLIELYKQKTKICAGCHKTW